MIGNALDAQRVFLSRALMLLIGAALALLFFIDTPKSNDTAINLILGGLLTKLIDVFGYSFNTNADSAGKNALIATLATATAQALPANGNGTQVLQPGDAIKATVTDDGATVTTIKE